jgi:hypothetical protein
MVFHMLESEFLKPGEDQHEVICNIRCIGLLLALRMKVNALNGTGHLVKTYVIEAFKTGPVDRPDAVIRH